MQITPHEAHESLAAIDDMMQRMRHAAASGGAHYFLILWGCIWIFGFLGSHFFSEKMAGAIWLGLDVLGGFCSWLIGMVQHRRVRNTSMPVTGKRIGMFWLSLFIYCLLTVWVAWPIGGKKLAMFIIIFVMVGWIAMGFLLSLSVVGLALLITAVACMGYFLLPAYFYLWMALLGGGTMIGSGLYIRFKWLQS